MRPTKVLLKASLTLSTIILFFLIKVDTLSQNRIRFQEIKNGVEFANEQITTSNDSVSINILKINRRKNRIVVLKSSDILGKYSPSESFIYSLRNLYQILEPVALINGGFTASFQFPIPVGLIIHNRQTLAPINKNTKTNLQEAIFCILSSQINGVRIFNYRDFINTNPSCFEALQNGPLIISNERNQISNSQDSFTNKAFARSIIAIDKQNNILLVQTSRASLKDVVEFLLKDESKGGLSCVSAINLSGSTDSGMIVQSNNEYESFGYIDSTVPSVIAVYSRE